MRTLLTFLLLLTSATSIHAAPHHDPSCLNEKAMKALDAGWERAYLERDAAFLEQLLAEEFVWVHTHASQIDSKADVLRAITTTQSWNIVSRVQSEVVVRILDSTAIVTGYTVVTRTEGATRYAFMRTYVRSSGRCLLLANQTMAIPAGD